MPDPKNDGTQGFARLKNLLGLATRKRPEVGVTPADVVHQENKWKLLRYRRSVPVKHATPILFVPSLINRHYVMDLVPGKSMAEWFVAQGHDVYCIDWGTPSDEDRFLTFDDVCDKYVARALRVACKTAGSEKAHVLGYCLGGTLAVIHAAARPERIASMALLAAPVSFKDDGPLAAWTQNPEFDPEAITKAFGNAPWPLLQGAFHMLRPTLNLAKAVHLIDRAWNDEFLDGFLALETWGNDNVSFPGRAFVRYIKDLYQRDALVTGEMRLGGRPAKMESIACPLLAVSFEHDNIVPWKSAALLVDRAASSDKTHVKLPGGHVGAVVSKQAAKGLWPMLSKFFVDHEATPTVEPALGASTSSRAVRASARAKSQS
ncbi:MAG TPA: alpha/beta fold hydrolase [Polyangiaceae bacterium]